VVSFTLRPLYLREKDSRYPLDRRLGEPQNRSERHEEEKNLDLRSIEKNPMTSSGIEPATFQLVA
jgi:hypothetical protein